MTHPHRGRLTAFGRRTLSVQDLDLLINEAAQLVAETLEAESVDIWERRIENDCFLLRGGIGWPDVQIGETEIPAHAGLLPGFTLLQEGPVCVQDHAVETRFAQTKLSRERGISASLSVPLGERDDPLGVLGAHTTHPRNFTDDEVALLQAVAAILAAAIRRHQGDRALRESEARLGLLAEASERVFFFEHDEEHRLTYLSSSVKAVLGYEARELLGTRYDSLLGDEESQIRATVETDRALSTGRRGDSYELVARHRDGHLVVLEIVEQPIDTAKGTRSIQGFCWDVTERHRATEAMERRLAVEEALRRVSSSLVSAIQPDLEEALSVLGNLVEASRSYIFLFRDRGATMDNTHEWCAAGVRPQKEALQGLPTEGFPWWIRCIRTGEPLAISDASALPEEASVEREILEAQDIRSALVVPLPGMGGEIRGFIGFDDTRGTRRWTEEEVRALQVAGDVIAGVLHRTEAERSLRESEEYYRALIERQGDLVAVIDQDGTTRFASPSYERVLGLRPDSLIGRNLLELVHPDDLAEVRSRLTLLLGDSRREAWMRLRVRHAEGGWRTHVVSGRNLLDVPAVRGIVVTGSDVTEWEETEERLRLLSRAVEQSPVSILITDPDGAIVYANPKFTAVTGWTVEEVLGQNPRLLKSGKHDDAFYANLWQTIKGGREWHGEMENRRKDGGLFREAVSISPVLNANRQITHFIAAKEDITESHLLQEKYLQAQKMEAVGRLAAGVAHDFNNLLTAIHGSSEFLLQDLPETSSLREDAEEIQRAVRRATSLTRQLLAFSRRQDLEETVLDMREVVRYMEPMLRRLLPESIMIQRRLPDEALTIKADQSQIEQVILNLAVNAGDAMEGQGTLTFSALTVDLPRVEAEAIPWHIVPGTFVELSVSDTGCGMAEEVRGHIFDPFFTTKPEGKGTGLGLSTVFGIVKQSGGHIFVESEPGLGTTFRVLLPLVAAPNQEEAPTRKEGAPPPSRDATVLVVEDDPTVRGLTRRVLHQAGYKVLEAGNGREALRVAGVHGQSIDLVVSDIVMPEMGGPTLVESLKESYPGLAALFVSGYWDAGLPGTKGATSPAILRKPYSSEDLLRLVAKALQEDPESPAD